MRRKNKCANKKPYTHHSAAFEQVVRNYINGNGGYGIYECPVCSDFHITSKYDNRTKKQKRRCLYRLLKVELPVAQTIMHLKRKTMYADMGITHYSPNSPVTIRV